MASETDRYKNDVNIYKHCICCVSTSCITFILISNVYMESCMKLCSQNSQKRCSNITAGQVISGTEAWAERWHHWPPSSHGSGVWEETYFVHGQMHRPQHLAMSVRFFSASFMSLLIWSRPSSMRSSCSAHAREMGKGNWKGKYASMHTKTHKGYIFPYVRNHIWLYLYTSYWKDE